MKKQYLLGVDGGNTKTLYLLHDTEGKFVDHVAAGTCSHEALADGFRGAEAELGRQISALFARNGIAAGDIAFAVFGLAGCDFPHQKQALSEIVARLGFENFIVENDGFLGLKAGSASGVGICSINGTGTVTVGINGRGERLQIGGLGTLSSDRAGGDYIAQRGAAAVYDSLFRCGRATLLKDMFFEAFRISSDEEFPYRATQILSGKSGVLQINKMMEEAEKRGDEVVKELLRTIGSELAQNVLGCASRLDMKGEVPVVLTGSVWAKGNFVSMTDAFQEALSHYKKCAFSVNKLKQPPAAGAVIWAMEEYRKRRPELPISFSRTALLACEAFAKISY